MAKMVITLFWIKSCGLLLTFWRNTSPPSSLSGSITLKMEVIHSSKTLLTTHKTQDHDQQHTIGCDQYMSKIGEV
jgi:hypothetical protein